MWVVVFESDHCFVLIHIQFFIDIYVYFFLNTDKTTSSIGKRDTDKTFQSESVKNLTSSPEKKDNGWKILIKRNPESIVLM